MMSIDNSAENPSVPNLAYLSEQKRPPHPGDDEFFSRENCNLPTCIRQ